MSSPVTPIDVRGDAREAERTTDGAGASAARDDAARAAAGGVGTPSPPLVELIAACIDEDKPREQLRAYMKTHPPDGLASLEHEARRAFIDAYARDFRQWCETGGADAAGAADVEHAAHGEPGCTIEETALRGITLGQLSTFFESAVRLCEAEGWTSTDPKREGERLTRATITLYDLATHRINPLAHETARSVVETLAPGPQPPAWFVSHWWGEPVADMIACLEKHRRDRALPEDCAYWICAYALRQSSLGLELAGGVRDTPFVRALHIADGSVSLLDEQAVALTRAWCALELYESNVTQGAAFLHDLYAARGGGEAVGLVDGLAKGRGDFSADDKIKEENFFPEETLWAGAKFALSRAQAARADDLAAIAAAVGDAADTLDATVRARFLAPQLRQTLGALVALPSAEMEAKFSATLRDLRASRLRKLALAYIEDSPTGSMQKVGEAMPASVQQLELFKVLDHGWVAGACVLIARGQLRLLGVRECDLGRADAQLLDAALGAADCRLVSLDLRANQLGDAGGTEIGRALETNCSLTKLDLGSNRLDDAAGMLIGRALENNGSLTWLNLGENKMGDAAGIALARGLEASRSLAELQLDENELTDEAGVAFGHALETNGSLTVLVLARNLMGDAAGTAIGRALETNRSLTILDLSSNFLGDDGAAAILRVLDAGRSRRRRRWPTVPCGAARRAVRPGAASVSVLTELRLSGNEIGYSSNEALRVAWAGFVGSRAPHALEVSTDPTDLARRARLGAGWQLRE